jgi:anti-anti-sigma regulatory factor
MSGRFAATTTGRSLGEHMCLPFRGTDELVAAALGYVAEGLHRHERVSFCRIAPDGMQHAIVSDLAQVGRSADADLPVLLPLSPEPGWAPSTSPIPVFGRMTEAAVADGYAGLRVLTDATEIVRDPDSRPWWVRGEHLIDRYGPVHPLTVVCGYDVELVGEEILTEVACLHALTAGVPSPFLLRAVGGGLALVGEVDRTSAVNLYHALMGIAADLSRPVVLDLSEHEFIDHSALAALDRAARRLGTRIELVGASPLTACLVDVLGLTGVTVREDS